MPLLIICLIRRLVNLCHSGVKIILCLKRFSWLMCDVISLKIDTLKLINNNTMAPP